MQSSDIPSKFNIPFASSAGTSYIRTVPQASQIGIQDGAASLTDGFPPLNFLPVGSGGVPPFGQDFNGLLNLITQWSIWQALGGQAYYDATFAGARGGYPKGAILIARSGAGAFTSFWRSTINNNVSDPDAGGAGWVGFNLPDDVYVTDTGTANTIVGTPVPAIAAYAEGRHFLVKVNVTNTGATTVNLNGLGAAPLVNVDGSALAAGTVVADGIYLLTYDGTSFQVLNPTASSLLLNAAQAFGAVQLNLDGSNLRLTPYFGDQIFINGVFRTVPSAGVAVAPTGASSSQIRYVYATWSGSAIVLVHNTNPPAAHPVYRLLVQNNDLTATYVGIALTTAGSLWQDRPGLASHFNAQPRAFSANNSGQSTTTSTAFIEISSTRITFVCNDGYAVVIGASSMRADTLGVNADGHYAVGIDAVAAAQGTAARVQQDTWVPASSYATSAVLSRGSHFATSVFQSANVSDTMRVDNITTLLLVNQ